MITSPSNPRIRDARQLSQKRRRVAEGRFLVEGVRLISDALASGVRPHEVFYAPEVVAGQTSAVDLLARLEAAQIACWACTPHVFRTLSETVTPQGIVAVAPLPVLPLPNHPTLTLLLDQVREPGNAGTLLRAAEAAGVEQVIFAPETVDPFNDKVVRAGMGVHFRLPLLVLAHWEELHRSIPPATPLYVAEVKAPLSYDRVDWRGPAVLVIGGEAAGAGQEVRALATPIAIPMQAAVESLNAAIAGAVILFEAARQRRQGRDDHTMGIDIGRACG